MLLTTISIDETTMRIKKENYTIDLPLKCISFWHFWTVCIFLTEMTLKIEN